MTALPARKNMNLAGMRGEIMTRGSAIILSCLVAAGCFFFASSGFAADWSPLVNRLVADGFDEGAMRSLFARPEAAFDPMSMVVKIRTLIRTKDFKPSTTPGLRTKAVYKGYLKPAVINRARAYYQENQAVLSKIRRQYCVPESIIVSIVMVETQLGRNTGSRRAFNVLASMALCEDLDLVRDYLRAELAAPGVEAYARDRCREKSAWAYDELKALIKYSQASGTDPLTIPGSIYGAIGLCQFMPTNAFLYGVDGNKDGQIDLFASHDALYSIGNYLSQKGWSCRMDRKKRHDVIMTYNRSQVYANTVLAVADRVQGKPAVSKKTKRQRQREG